METRSRIPILAISLADCTERRRALVESMGRLGLPFRFVDAIDGRGGLPPGCRGQYDDAGAFQRLGRTLSPAEIAASLSHALVYRTILRARFEHALILEDDAIPRPGLRSFLDARGYEAAPMVLLHHLNARVLGPPRTAADGTRLRELAVPCFRATAYTVSREAAAFLLAAGSPVTTPPDWPGDITSIGACVTDPQLVDHPPEKPGQSTLAAGRTRDHAPLSRIFRLTYPRRTWRKLQSEKIS